MTMDIPHPPIVTEEVWLAERKKLLEEEKAITRANDEVNAHRRRLPMVKIEKEYIFENGEGKRAFAELFEGKRQLIIYHFMFDPSWDKGCRGCTGFVESLGNLASLADRDTTFALISRAPIKKLEKYKAEKGWTLPWYSSFGSDFNYDFHVTFDASVAPVEYNYRNEEELIANGDTGEMTGEGHALSVFFRLDDDTYHTYSTFARGVERLTDTYELLDCTPYGRQEDFEDSPPGWPQKPTYG